MEELVPIDLDTFDAAKVAVRGEPRMVGEHTVRCHLEYDSEDLVVLSDAAFLLAKVWSAPRDTTKPVTLKLSVPPGTPARARAPHPVAIHAAAQARARSKLQHDSAHDAAAPAVPLWPTPRAEGPFASVPSSGIALAAAARALLSTCRGDEGRPEARSRLPWRRSLRPPPKSSQARPVAGAPLAWAKVGPKANEGAASTSAISLTASSLQQF